MVHEQCAVFNTPTPIPTLTNRSSFMSFACIQIDLPPYFLKLYYTWPPVKKVLKSALSVANNVYELQYLYERKICDMSDFLYEREV